MSDVKDSESVAAESCGSYCFDEEIRAADVGFAGTALKNADETRGTLSDELLAQFAGTTCNAYSGALTLTLRDGIVVGYRYETQNASEAENFAEIRRNLSQALQRFSI